MELNSEDRPMRTTRTLFLITAAAAALAWAGCGAESGDPGGSDGDSVRRGDVVSGPDTPPPDAPPPDTPPDTPPGIDTVESPPCEGPGLAGRVVRSDGSPIGGAKLFLCGVVGGSETCNGNTADDHGGFAFETLDPGYTHLEVNATLAGVQLGKLFAGYSLAVDPSGPECVDMGQIVLQELPGGETVITGDGGVIQIGAVTLEFPAGCPVFPDFSPQGDVGGAAVEVEEAYWVPEGAVMAVALHPFKAHCDAGVTVRVSADASFAAPVLLYNDLELGGAHEVGAMTADGDGWSLEAAVPDLTWIWVTD